MTKGILLSLLLIILSTSLKAQYTKALYGADDRQDVHEYADAEWQKRAFSTASMIHEQLIYELDGVNDGHTLIFGGTYQESQNLCPDVRFANQIASASCSGFLIAPDLIATAGHCVDKKKLCKDHKWVFGFHQRFEIELENSTPIITTTSNVYNCKKMIRHRYSTFGADFAVVQLDRPVENYQPLEIRKSGKIGSNDPLIVIGNPNGIPTKIADNATVQSNWGPNSFATNLDTFSGNSGSAVFNADTGIVEGILVKGYRWSYTEDKYHGCFRPTVLSENGGDAIVTRITKIIPGSPELPLE